LVPRWLVISFAFSYVATETQTTTTIANMRPATLSTRFTRATFVRVRQCHCVEGVFCLARAELHLELEVSTNIHLNIHPITKQPTPQHQQQPNT